MNQIQAQPVVHAWLDAVRAGIADIALQALSAIVQFGPGRELGGQVAGALVPIVSNLEPVQLGLFSTDAGCEALARLLLGSSPDERLSRADVVDAVGEIVNMLSGNVKARVARYATHAALGLPTFVHGPIESCSGQVVEVLQVTIGEAEAYVVVIHAA